MNFVTPTIAVIANQDGLLFIGNQLVRFVDDKEIVVKDGDIAKAMNWQHYASKDVVVANTSNIQPQPISSSNARIAALCRRIAGSSGNTTSFRDGATVETKLHKTYIPLGEFETAR